MCCYYHRLQDIDMSPWCHFLSFWRAILAAAPDSLWPLTNPKEGKEMKRGWSTDFLDELLVQLTAQQAILFDQYLHEKFPKDINTTNVAKMSSSVTLMTSDVMPSKQLAASCHPNRPLSWLCMTLGPTGDNWKLQVSTGKNGQQLPSCHLKGSLKDVQRTWRQQ